MKAELTECIRQGNVDEIIDMLSHHMDLNVRIIEETEHGIIGHTLLSYLLFHAPHGIEAMEWLLNHGFDINECRYFIDQHKVLKYSALCDAVGWIKEPEIVKLLLRYGANPDDKIPVCYKPGVFEDMSLLSVAVYIAENVDISRLLLEWGAKSDEQIVIYYESGVLQAQSLLHVAVLNLNNVKLARLLLEYGSDPNEVVTLFYEDGRMQDLSLLSLAIALKHTDMAGLLLEYGGHTEGILSSSAAESSQY